MKISEPLPLHARAAPPAATQCPWTNGVVSA